MKTSEPAITCSRSAAARRSVGSPAGSPGKVRARLRPSIGEDRRLATWAASWATGTRRSRPRNGASANSSARARQAATPSNSSPWTPPTTDSVGPSAATDQVDQRETLRPVGGGGDPLSPRMGHHGAVRIVPPALTSRGWIVDNLTGAAQSHRGPEGDSVVDATDAPSFIGVARARVDSEEKVRGATRYAADQRQPGPAPRPDRAERLRARPDPLASTPPPRWPCPASWRS